MKEVATPRILRGNLQTAEDQHYFEFLESAANRFFSLGLGFSFLLLLMGAVLVGVLRPHPSLSRALQVVTFSMTLAVSAAMQGLAEKLVLAEQFRQYQRMGQVYSRASRPLTGLMESGSLREKLFLIMELGREALIENGDWLVLQRARPIDMPRG